MIRFPQPWAYNQTPPDVHPKIKPRYHIHICVPCYNEPSDIVFATCALLTLTRTRTRTRTRTPLPTPNPPNPHTQPNPNPNPNPSPNPEPFLRAQPYPNMTPNQVRGRAGTPAPVGEDDRLHAR